VRLYVDDGNDDKTMAIICTFILP